jgi:hypothetical protein
MSVFEWVWHSGRRGRRKEGGGGKRIYVLYSPY